MISARLPNEGAQPLGLFPVRLELFAVTARQVSIDHFRSKDELLLAALEQTMAGLSAPPTNSIAELRQVLIGFAGEMQSLDLGLLFQATLQAHRDVRVATAVQSYLSEFRAYIAGALVGVEGDVERLSQAIAAPLDGLLLHLAIDPETDVQAVLSSVLELLVGAEKRGA